MRWSPPVAIDSGDLHHDKLFKQIIKMDSILFHFVIYDTHANNLFLSGNWILIKKCPDNLFGQIVYIKCLFILWCIRYEFSEIAINHNLNPIFTIQAILFNSTYLMLLFLRNIWISLQKCPETWFPGSWLFAFWIMNFCVKCFLTPYWHQGASLLLMDTNLPFLPKYWKLLSCSDIFHHHDLSRVLICPGRHVTRGSVAGIT